ncbi:MAG: glycine cleavage system protein GcvH [Candidatus Aminicenantes bacterium]|jgi:glycine cleavage system H protein|nr:glycine cleavage system protein GcvH [Candidatus Aminicenantes bacterium]
MYPQDFSYTKDHEWVQVKGDQALVGITEFAQKQLGDVVYIELPAVGSQLDVHQTIGSIESVKAVSEVFSPVSGEVVEVNADLNGSPELVNQDPHGKGWIIRLKLKNKADLNPLMKAAEYEKFLEGLEH